MRTILAVTLMCLAAGLFAVPVEAAKRKGVRASNPPHVVKDCTRLNGRFGYYGNPWCTQAEQDAWDRATSRTTR